MQREKGKLNEESGRSVRMIIIVILRIELRRKIIAMIFHIVFGQKAP